MTRTTAARCLILLILAAAAVACDFGNAAAPTPTGPDQSAVPYSQTDLTVGSGTEATAGRSASVTYTGWLYSETGADKKGKQFDQGQFTFLLGANTVIKGFDTGVTGMKVGGLRRVTIPPSQAYGAQGNTAAGIPPNAALVFEVGLVNVQ